MKLSAYEFRKLFAQSGGKMTARGRPIIDISEIFSARENKKVRGAKKVIGDSGEVLADSRLEYSCKLIIEESGLEMDFQRCFDLLPTIRREGLPTLRKRIWKPDFTFEKHHVVADAKGHVTEVAKLKIHLFLYLYPDWDVVILRNKNDVYNLIKTLKQNEQDNSV